jgi:hypothetical protein
VRSLRCFWCREALSQTTRLMCCYKNRATSRAIPGLCRNSQTADLAIGECTNKPFQILKAFAAFAIDNGDSGLAFSSRCISGANSPARVWLGLRAMISKIPAIERAFQLARSGSVANINELKSVMHKERYGREELQGLSLGRQLKAIIKAAREGRDGGRA